MKIIGLSWEVNSVPGEIHVVPIGEWKDRGFVISEAECAEIVRNFEEFGIRLVIDWEHQSLNCAENGAPAPAVGWIGKLEVRENGVWATEVEWTAEGRRMLEAKEYRYISPVLVFDDHDPHTNEYIGCALHSVAITNTPYFRSDLEPLVARRETDKPQEGKEMETEVTDQEQVTALKAENASLAGKIEALEAKLAETEAQIECAATERLVEEAIAAKKLLPAQKEVALIVGKQGKETLEKFIAANVIPDLEKKVDVAPGKAGEGLKYADLLQDPAQLQKMKNEAPEQFEALRSAYLGG